MHYHVHCSIIYNSQDMETSKYLLINEWIKQLWYIHKIEYYSTVKRDEILPSV